MIPTTTLWAVIIGLGIGSFGLRFVFLGLIGSRRLPLWLQRHLRYTAVAVLPALIAPMVLGGLGPTDAASGGRIATAAVALAVGYLTKSPLYAILAGAMMLMGLSLLGIA